MPRPLEDYISRANRRAEMHAQGVKGLFILNGGGTLALLTFVTQLMVSGPQFYPLVTWVTRAIASMTAGLVLAAAIHHLRYESSRLYDNEETKRSGERYARFHRVLFWSSLALFVAGVAFALGGMLRFGAPVAG